jgi:hypothetical protein
MFGDQGTEMTNLYLRQLEGKHWAESKNYTMVSSTVHLPAYKFLRSSGGAVKFEQPAPQNTNEEDDSIEDAHFLGLSGVFLDVFRKLWLSNLWGEGDVKSVDGKALSSQNLALDGKAKLDCSAFNPITLGEKRCKLYGSRFLTSRTSNANTAAPMGDKEELSNYPFGHWRLLGEI